MDHADPVTERHRRSGEVGDNVRNLQAQMDELGWDCRRSSEQAEAGREEAEVVCSPGVGTDHVGDKLEGPAAHGLDCASLARRPEAT